MGIKVRIALLSAILVVVGVVTLIWAAQMRPGMTLNQERVDEAYAAMGVGALTGPASDPRIVSPADTVSPKQVLEAAAPKAIDIARFQMPQRDALAVAPDTAGEAERGFDVRFELTELTERQLTPRARSEQLRDWLLFAAVGEHVESADQLREVFFDFPVVRYGHMEAVSTFEFGPTRGRAIGDGRAVGLIPAGLNEAARIDALAEVADALRKDLGEILNELLVYEYEIDEATASGRLVLATQLAGETLFSSAFGYVERSIRSEADLRAFLGAVDDIVYAAFADGSRGLRLGGRKLEARSYRNIEYEHVATLWQAERDVQRNKDEFERWRSQLLADYNSRLNRSGAFDQQLLQQQYDAEVMSEQLRRRLTDGSGFSLDPTFDFSGLARELRELAEIDFTAFGTAQDPATMALLEQVSAGEASDQVDAAFYALRDALHEPAGVALERFGQLCEYWTPDHATVFVMRLSHRFVALNEIEDLSSELVTLAAQLTATGDDTAKSSEDATMARPFGADPAPGPRSDDERVAPIYQYENELLRAGDARSELIQCAINRNSYQSARYDGPLQGTEVGMVLFYTDLLAKIWAIKHADADPSVVVEGFVNLYNQRIEPIFEAETDALPSARLWFGHNNRGFGLAAGGNSDALVMARTATRIYAAGSNPINPGEEVQTSRLMGAPMKWWNDHYDEVARHEPQYQRLNEIMKWSLILGWLNDAGAGDLLDFLGSAEVRRDFWFPEWARAQPDLKFAAWETVPFFERGYLGKQTETMPMLATFGPSAFDPSQATGFSGGVSLAPRQVFASRVKPIADVPAASRRSFLDYADAQGGRALTSLDDAAFRFTDRGVGVTAKAAEGTRRQGIGGELSNADVVRAFSATRDGQAIQVSVNGSDIGVLFAEQSGGAFKIGFQSRAIDRAHDVTRAASTRVDDLSGSLAAANDVTRTLEVAGTAGAKRYAQVGRAKEWIEVEADPMDGITIAAGWTGRAAEFGAPRGLRYKIVSNDSVRRSLDEVETVVYRLGDEGGVVARASAETAPVGGRPIAVRIGGVDVPARSLDDGSVAVSVRDLPTALRDQPDRLSGLLGTAELEAARAGESVVVSPHAALWGEIAQVRQALASGDRRLLGVEAARRPEAVKQALEIEYRSGLERVHHHLAEGNPRSALAEIDALTRVFGETPDLALRRGLAALRAGRLADAAQALNRIPAAPLKEPKSFVDEVAARLGGGKPPEPPFGGNRPAGSSASGRNGGSGSFEGGSGTGGARPSAYERALKVVDYQRRHPRDNNLRLAIGLDKEVRLELHLSDDALSKGRVATADTLKAAISPDGRVVMDVYVQQGGPLSKLDWSEKALPETLVQVVNGNLGQVVRLPVGNAAAYRPSHLYHGTSKQRFERATTGEHAGSTMDWPALRRAFDGELHSGDLGDASGDCTDDQIDRFDSCAMQPRPVPGEVLVVLEK